jgi:hypothetical protein
MRTTLDIDDDVLAAAKEIARRDRESAGQVVSRLLRAALVGSAHHATSSGHETSATGGFRPFASRSTPLARKRVAIRLGILSADAERVPANHVVALLSGRAASGAGRGKTDGSRCRRGARFLA